MKESVQFLFVALLLFNNSVSAQNNQSSPKKWGIETELVQPFIPDVGIYRIQATYTLTAPEKRLKGDLLFGGYIRPNTKHDVVEKINEYLLMTGYRQYFWKGLHAEAKSNIGYAWGTKNLINGKDYNNFSWFWEANAGYKLDFAKRRKTNFYAIGQFGVISKVIADIGPRGGKPDTFLQGNLLVGINF